jgi:hypothetical protein
MPLTGVGAVAVPVTSRFFHLIVHERDTDTAIWTDSRKVEWTRGGAVAGLVEDLFKRIEEYKEETRYPPGIQPTETGWRAIVEYRDRQYSRRFPADTDMETMVQWQENERARLTKP